jgi:predicted methyltransferase
MSYLFVRSLLAGASCHRSLANRDRDKYRYPAETLKFFGLRPNMAVVELWTGSGWYTEILAPFLASKGQLIVTNSATSSKPTLAFQQKLAVNPEVFGKVKRIGNASLLLERAIA